MKDRKAYFADTGDVLEECISFCRLKAQMDNEDMLLVFNGVTLTVTPQSTKASLVCEYKEKLNAIMSDKIIDFRQNSDGMDIENLTLGDYIMYNERYVKIIGLQMLGDIPAFRYRDKGSWVSLHAAEPIPLRKCHVTANGFKLDEEGLSYERDNVCVSFYKDCIYVRFKCKFEKEIKYVHELQNILRVHNTNIELIP